MVNGVTEVCESFGTLSAPRIQTREIVARHCRPGIIQSENATLDFSCLQKEVFALCVLAQSAETVA